MNSNTSHTARTDAHTLSAHHIALIPCTTSVAQVIVSLHLSRAMSHAVHGAPSTSSSTFSSVQALQRLLTSRISCDDRRERGSDGYTDPEPGNGYEPIRLPKLRVRHYRTHKTDLLNLDENMFDYKKNCL